MFEGWKHRLNVLFIEHFLGGYAGQREMNFGDYEDTVYLFESGTISGMLFWGDIFLNQDLFEEEYRNARQKVYLHELGHRQQPKIMDFLCFTETSLHPALVSLELLLILTAAISFVFSLPLSGSTVELVRVAGVALTIYLPLAVATSWIIETNADLFVIKHIGAERYRKALEELRNRSPERTAIGRIYGKIASPPEKLVLRTLEWTGNTSS